MSGRLIDAVYAVTPDVSAEDLGDAVWLLAEVRRRSARTTARPGEPGQPDAQQRPPPGRPDGRRPDRPATPDHPPPGQPPGGTAPDQPPPGTPANTTSVDWYLPSPDRLFEHPDRVPVRSPGAAALPGMLATARALRPLRRRMPSRTATVLDEEATVRAAVDSDLWIPVLRPALGRWLDLALVIDSGASMVIWQHAAAELRELLERMGAFRDVRVWRIDSDRAGGALPHIRAEGEPADRRGRDVRELVDPTGRRVVLVVSDCVGAAWGDGGMERALRIWGGAGPLAVVQTLPQRLWRLCAPDVARVWMSARRPVARNTELRVAPHEPTTDTRAAVPVPVLELDSRWFTRWAALIAGIGPEWVPGSVILAREPAGPVRPDEAGPWRPPAPEADNGPGPEELLLHYQDFASTEAMRLAVCLAGAPLNLPVMRMIQQVMLPDSRPSVLAEVFLGGLLRRQSAGPPDRRMPDPDEVDYDFVPGVRERLLAALPRHDRLTVLSRVSDFVARRLGSPYDFRAIVRAEDTAAGLLDRDRPFARVALDVLSDTGGRYGEAAEQLRRKMITNTPVASDIIPERRMAHSSNMSTAPAVTAPPHVSEVSRQPQIFGGVPFRNPHFTGRHELLDRLRSMLERGTSHMALLPQALHGLGGVGKTQLAIEYAYRYASEYDLVWWVPAESPTTARSSLARLAAEMKLPVGDDIAQTIANVQGVLRAGQAYPRWLIVFDNADEPDDVKDYLPVPRGHVLVTSRNPHWAEVAAQVEVDVFSRAESVALLQSRGHGISAGNANELAEKLGDLPLALDQAAAWQGETGMPMADMLRLLDERFSQLLAESVPANYPGSVMVTWDLAFGRLREQSLGAAQLLEICAFFGAEPISVPLLREGRNVELPAALATVLRDDIMFRRAVRDLGRYALAKIDPAQDRIEIHRLVQAVLREQMTPEHREATQDAVHRILGAANPEDPDSPRTWERHQELMPHVTPSGVISAKEDRGRRVALDQIRYRYIRGDALRSGTLAEEALAVWRTELGPDHELTLIAQRHLAIALRAQGRYQRSAALNEETYARMRAVFGDDHEHTLATANSVGADLRLRGDLAAARALDEDTLARHRRLYPKDDPVTLRPMNNLAVDLRLLGDVTGALELDLQVFETYRQMHGVDHPFTAQSLVNTAHDYFDAGRYVDARTLLTDALPAVAARLGEDARATLLAKRILAMTLRRLGRTAPALEVAEEQHSTALQVYRPTHLTALSAAATYANTLLAGGEHAQARRLAEEAYGGLRDRLGPEHLYTLGQALNLALATRTDGESETARALDEETLSALRRVVGDDHPFTLAAMANLANDCAATYDHQRGRELSDEAYQRSRRVRGPEHPETLICGLNHALDLRAAGDRTAAKALLDEVRARLEREFGEQHPSVRAAAEGRRAEFDVELWEI